MTFSAIFRILRGLISNLKVFGSHFHGSSMDSQESHCELKENQLILFWGVLSHEREVKQYDQLKSCFIII